MICLRIGLEKSSLTSKKRRGEIKSKVQEFSIDLLKKIKADEEELLDTYNDHIDNKRSLLITTKTQIQKLLDDLTTNMDSLNLIDNELICNKRFLKEEHIINRVEDLECSVNKLIDQANKTVIPDQNELFKIYPNEVFLSKIQVLANIVSGKLIRANSAPYGLLWAQ